MTDTWKDIQNVKSKQSSIREKIEKRKRMRETILGDVVAGKQPRLSTDPKTAVASAANVTTSGASVLPTVSISTSLGTPATLLPLTVVPSVTIPCKGKSAAGDTGKDAANDESTSQEKDGVAKVAVEEVVAEKKVDSISSEELEKRLLVVLEDLGVTIDLPVRVQGVMELLEKDLKQAPPKNEFVELLQKFSIQRLISMESGTSSQDVMEMEIKNADNAKLAAFLEDVGRDNIGKDAKESPTRRDGAADGVDDIENLLGAYTAKERELKRINEEISELLNKPTAREVAKIDRFRSQGGSQVQQFCPFGTREECNKMRRKKDPCRKLHFRKIIQSHTDESLGDCSFLNTCFHIETCKYVHYEIDQKTQESPGKTQGPVQRAAAHITLYPPQWINCDMRCMDTAVLGKFAVIMADPPWDIHMELPYGTMQDDEMRQLNIPSLQDEGYIFLWVTGRAMELGRECLKLWGYERCDEIIWVKTNQLQRIIRTGRTGHWINHGKEHCLVGVKGELKGMNVGLDCDVIVSEVRETSHKPDEIYGIIERLSPGTRKLELFGRPHNVQPNWITIGNQLNGTRLVDPEVVERFKKRYPTGVVTR